MRDIGDGAVVSRRKDVAVALRSEADCLQHEMAPSVELLREAADLLDPPDDGETVEARVLVRVDVDNDGMAHYNAAGWNDDAVFCGGTEHAPDDAVRDQIDEFAINAGAWTENARWTWITARVPKPAPVAEVEGTVEP